MTNSAGHASGGEHQGSSDLQGSGLFTMSRSCPQCPAGAPWHPCCENADLGTSEISSLRTRTRGRTVVPARQGRRRSRETRSARSYSQVYRPAIIRIAEISWTSGTLPANTTITTRQRPSPPRGEPTEPSSVVTR